MWDCMQEYIFYKMPKISHDAHGLCEASHTNTILERGYENSTPSFNLQSAYYPWLHWQNQVSDTIFKNKTKIDQNSPKMDKF